MSVFLCFVCFGFYCALNTQQSGYMRITIRITIIIIIIIISTWCHHKIFLITPKHLPNFVALCLLMILSYRIIEAHLPYGACSIVAMQ